jgi:hypothetical protein
VRRFDQAWHLTQAVAVSCAQVMVIFIVFGGVYVNAENVPRGLKWLPNISLIKYCFEALCVNEFRGLDFETQRRPGEVATGEQVRQPHHMSVCRRLC